MNATASSIEKPLRLAPALASLVVLRFAMDASFRAPLPFITFIAAAFGADPASAGWLAVALSAAGLFAPFIGVAEGHLGRRTVVMLSCGTFITACLLLPFAPAFSVTLALFFVLGISKALFTPQVQAFIGDVVPYEKRGTAIGIVELSWALSFIIGAPLFGFMVARVAWWAPFVLMGIVAFVGLLLTLRYAITKNTALIGATEQLDGSAARAVLRHRPAILFLVFGALISFAHQLMILSYAPYMIQTFGMTPVQLGLASIVLGVADVIAELLTIALVDRVGKRRAVLVSTALYIVSLGLVIVWAGALAPLLAGLFLVSLTFEFALVASLPVASELVPPARATMMGFVTFVHSFGRIIASLIALPLFALGQITLVMAVALIAVVLSFVAFLPVRVSVYNPKGLAAESKLNA
jgi:predicted MFS family arabinose efflux permease